MEVIRRLACLWQHLWEECPGTNGWQFKCKRCGEIEIRGYDY